MRLNRMVAGAAAVALIASAAVAGVVAAHGNDNRQGGEAGVPRYQHVFVIMMENSNYDQIIGNTNAPHINALAQRYGLATSYYGVTHPSEPNYVALVGGSYYGIQDDAPYTTHQISNPSLADQLTKAGLSWKTYQQSMPSVGYTGTTYPSSTNVLYASKHNPFMNFTSIVNNPKQLANSVPLDPYLQSDLHSGDVPNFSLIVPDQCHDMHGTSSCSDFNTNIQVGDAYVQSLVDQIKDARFWSHGNNAIVVTWDENDFNFTGTTGCCDANPGGGRVATIVITNHSEHPVQDATPYNHYSLLQTIQDAFRLGCLQNTCDTKNVTPMTKLFRGND